MSQLRKVSTAHHDKCVYLYKPAILISYSFAMQQFARCRIMLTQPHQLTEARQCGFPFL